jgi:hypothetical protein
MNSGAGYLASASGAAFLASEKDKWATVAKAANIELD